MQSTIEQKVMASVSAIYITRQLVGTTALKLYIFLAALWTLGRLVFVEQVFANWANVGVGGTATFVSAAVLNAEAAVQVTFALLVVAGLWLVRDLVRLTAARSRFG